LITQIEETETISCPFCKSTRVIKHGKTSADIQRYRCRFCHKTWIHNKIKKQAPDYGKLTEAYLSGLSYRDLCAIYHSSPIRINQKIRDYLEECPSWEEYLDAASPKHEARLIHLVGKKFKCSGSSNKEHCMYFALAIDALSTVVLGYEVGKSESKEVWIRLLDRMNCRGFVCPTFMSYGLKTIEDALKVVFPYAVTYNHYTRACYDKHLKSEIYYAPDLKKLIFEAINAYKINQTTQLKNYLVIFKDKRMKELVLNSKGYFINRLQERIDEKPVIRFEGLLRAFQKRFQKFHMIKYDPLPLINGWIAWWMLAPLPIGFSRLSLYLQKPCQTHFTNFNCGTLPVDMQLQLDSPEMRTFIVELAVRSLHIPVK
jgi:transposase-like protein